MRLGDGERPPPSVMAVPAIARAALRVSAGGGMLPPEREVLGQLDFDVDQRRFLGLRHGFGEGP
jgi:hypothetical protein